MIHTCIVGGWTDPRSAREHLGALLVGVPDDQGELRYVGRVASGFHDAQLGLVWKQLHSLKTKASPFAVLPDTTDRAHWVKPRVTVRVQFSGWTRDGRLRRPVFAGLDAPSSTSPARGAARQAARLRRTPTRSAPGGKNGTRERANKERSSVAADTTRRH